MKESNRQDFTLDDLDRLRQSELRPQEMIFAQIGDNGIYRPTLLALLSNSLRQYSRLRRELISAEIAGHENIGVRSSLEAWAEIEFAS
jgi:hypothetical protein